MSDAPPPGFREVSDAPTGFREVEAPLEKTGLVGLVKELPSLAVGAAKKTGRVALGLDEPQGLTDIALQTMTTAPIIGAGGALAAGAKIPAALGRIATAAGLGGGQAAARGTSPTWGALLDGIVAGLTEGASKAVQVARVPFGKSLFGSDLSLKDIGTPARGFAWATEAPGKALDLLRSRLPGGKWLNVPSLDKNPVSVDDAVKRLSTLTGGQYEMVREELARELSRFDVQRVTGPGPKAGRWFRDFTKPSRFEPSSGARLAESARRSLDDPTLRAGLDALATVETKGVPLGAIGGLGMLGAVPEGLGDIVSRIRR